MAQLISDLHKGLVRGTEIGDRKPELWLVGYSELKEKGLFQDFKRKWTDRELFTKYGLSDEEIAFINLVIKDWRN